MISSCKDHVTLKKNYYFLSARAMIIKFVQSIYEETPINLNWTVGSVSDANLVQTNLKGADEVIT